MEVAEMLFASTRERARGREAEAKNEEGFWKIEEIDGGRWIHTSSSPDAFQLERQTGNVVCLYMFVHRVANS